jgi:hypothetical protein
MTNSNKVGHGTLAHTYKLTVVDLLDGTPHTMYVASVEGLEAVPLWQAAREIEEQIRERGFLVGIEDLGAETLVLDMGGAGEAGRERDR